MSEKKASVVRVHGAWADGSSWAKVLVPLAARGLEAIAAPLPLTSFQDDVAALDRALERASSVGRPRLRRRRERAHRMGARLRAHPVGHTPGVTAPETVLAVIDEALTTVHT